VAGSRGPWAGGLGREYGTYSLAGLRMSHLAVNLVKDLTRTSRKMIHCLRRQWKMRLWQDRKILSLPQTRHPVPRHEMGHFGRKGPVQWQARH
jgi:hypothetical protein